MQGPGYFFATLNTKTKTIQYLNSPDGSPLHDETSSSNTHVITDDSSGSFIAITSDGVYLYKTQSSYSKKLPLSNNDYSVVRQKPLVSYSSGVLSGVGGVSVNESEEAGDGKDPAVTNNNLIIKQYDTNTEKELKTIKLSVDYAPYGFSQSANSDKFMLYSGEKAEIFVNNKKLKTVDVAIGGSGVYWRDDRRIAYIDPSLGLRSLDTQTGSLTTLFHSPLYSYSDFRFMKNDEILVSCYLKTPDSRIDLGAMLIKLVKKGSPSTSLTDKLPYSALQYTLDTFNDKVYFSALSFGTKDPIYEKSLTERQQTSSKTLDVAKKYLNKSGINQDVVQDIDVRSPEEFIVY